MKYGRGKWVYGTFLLVARDAARRFAFGHGNATGRCGSWRPLVLQWLRRRRRQQELSTGRAATPTPIVWFPQFHFHYATHLSNRSQSNHALISPHAARGPGTRMILAHRWTTVRAAELRQQPGSHYRTIGPFYVYKNSRPKIIGGSTNAPPWSRSAETPPIVPPVGRRSPALQFGVAARVVHAKSKIEERAQPFQTHSRILQHWLQILRVRKPTLDYYLPPRLPERNSQRVAFDDPEELVWRRRNSPAKEDTNFDGDQVTTNSFDRPAVRTFQRQEVVHSSPSPERAAVLPITSLDPSFVDRLTDDVIRRVEQRARIERQRRGL